MRTGYNERSWGIDLISAIKVWASARDLVIKGAGGERTLRTESNPLFPDVLLFGDECFGHIIQGWELKFPDTPITDQGFKDKAKEKAIKLKLNSFLLWNVSCAVLYVIDEDGKEEVVRTWNDLNHITKREQVEAAREGWHDLMEKILDDLADFFERGVIRSTSVLDSLTSDGVGNFILRNTGSVAAELRNQQRIDSDFDDMITLWWRSERKGYPGESDPCTVLARINLIVWLNKFLFAHILKRFYRQASEVESIDNNTSLGTAVRIFQNISTHCDFWNVFRSQLGGDKIPDLAWQDLVTFNNFLCEFKFEEIEQSLLHRILERAVYRWKRKVAGQFATPIEVAKLLVYVTMRNKDFNVLDPCCGTGTIARAAYDIKKEYGLTHERALATTWASDKFAFPLHMATLAMVEPANMGKTLTIFMKDATELEARTKVHLSNAYNGSSEESELPAIHYIVSNLPFVQQEDLETLNPGIKERVNGFIRSQTGSQHGLDPRSDLYAYLPFCLWSTMAENGLMGINLSNAWLATDYARTFRQHLNNFFQIEMVITSASGRWFEETDIVTNLVLLRRRRESELKDTTNRPAEKTNFVTINRPLQEIHVSGSLRELASLIRTENAGAPEITKRSYTNADISALELLGLGWSAMFADCSWLPGIASRLVRANSLFEIRRGERRGWDQMFYPLGKHGIEPEYIQRVLRSIRSIRGLIAHADGEAFCCTRSIGELEELGHTGALCWIRRFENQVNRVGDPLPEVLSRAGVRWYTMLPNTMADLVASINPDERLFIARLDQRSFVNQRLTRFTMRNPSLDTDLCHALINSLLGIFYLEALGFGRGLGVLDLSATKLSENLFILNPSLLGEEERDNICEKFDNLLGRNVLPIEEELVQADRIDFDNAVLDAYNIQNYKDLITNALLTLFEIRKAVSRISRAMNCGSK